MSATTFDTLMYAKKLQQAGFTVQQAEIQAETLKEIIEDNLASKQDIHNLHKDMLDIRKDMQQMEERLVYKLTIRLGLMLAASITLIAAIVKL